MNIHERLFPKQAKQIQHLEDRVKEFQFLIIDNILAVQEDTDSEYVGNAYRTYESAVKEIDKKYEGKSKWGVLQTGNIIDIRAAFIIGQGVKFIVDDPNAKNEKEWLEDFLSFNDLDKELSQEFAKEAEIEGKFLGQLFMDEKEKMVSVRFKSWTENNYTIKTNPKDYMDYIKATWKEASEDVTLEANEFIYKRFGGRIHKPNISPPKIAKCLTQIEHLDKALRDWREINRLFAAPTPHIEYETADEAKKGVEAVSDKNWKIKKFLSHTGKFGFAQPDASGSDALKEEILANARIISGTTGTPVHFLGMADLMSNRATAENLMEMIGAATSKERLIWMGAYKEIVDKAAAIWNEAIKKTPIDADKIRVDIPFITKEQWERIEKVYLPLYLANAITLDYLLLQIPGIDVEEEKQRREEEEKANLERAKKFGLPAKGEEEEEEEEE